MFNSDVAFGFVNSGQMAQVRKTLYLKKDDIQLR